MVLQQPSTALLAKTKADIAKRALSATSLIVRDYDNKTATKTTSTRQQPKICTQIFDNNKYVVSVEAAPRLAKPK